MPLIDINDANTWAAGTHYTGGYSRSNTALVEIIKKDAAGWRTVLKITSGKVLMVGCGFAFEAEEWLAAGIGSIVCADFSTWIQDNKASNATVSILNEDGTTTQSRNNIKQAGGITGNNKYPWGISCDMAPWLDDTECVKYASALRDMCSNVAHVISCGIEPYANPPPAGNWKTLAQWKALLAPDLVVMRVDPYTVM
jgi:hypothetical protein